MIVVKNKKAIEKMALGGRRLALAMKEIGKHVVEGMTTLQIDALLEELMLYHGLKPECKGYGGYKHASCISVNDVIVHGVPSAEIVLKSGDFVKIDTVGSYGGYCVDMTRSFFVGKTSTLVEKIAKVAQEALDAGISSAFHGARLFDISASIQSVVEANGFGVVRIFAGHGIGKRMHEEPDVPNFGLAGSGPLLKEGMTLAIEPMITQGSYDVKIMDDGWTAKTADGGFAAHVEDTILITKGHPRILTRI